MIYSEDCTCMYIILKYTANDMWAFNGFSVNRKIIK